MELGAFLPFGDFPWQFGKYALKSWKKCLNMEAPSSSTTVNTPPGQYGQSQRLSAPPQAVGSPYLAVQEEVVWFYVPMDESQLMDGVDGQHGLGDVELCLLFCQSVLLHQQRHHVT